MHVYTQMSVEGLLKLVPRANGDCRWVELVDGREPQRGLNVFLPANTPPELMALACDAFNRIMAGQVEGYLDPAPIKQAAE